MIINIKYKTKKIIGIISEIVKNKELNKTIITNNDIQYECFDKFIIHIINYKNRFAAYYYQTGRIDFLYTLGFDSGYYFSRNYFGPEINNFNYRIKKEI